MSEFSPRRRKVFLWVGIIVLIEVLVMFGLIFAGKTDLPVILPILLIIPGSIMLFFGLKK